MERFDLANKAVDVPVPSTETAPPATNSTNGYHTPSADSSKPKTESGSPSSLFVSTPVKDEDSDSDSDVINDEPPKKKRKSLGSGSVKKEVDDAKLAARLQAQENSRARPTRRGATTPKRKRPVVKKKKSEKKVKDEDESDMVGSDGEVKEKVRKGGFHVSFFFLLHFCCESGVECANGDGWIETISSFCAAGGFGWGGYCKLFAQSLYDRGTDNKQLSRPQVVKKIWEYIKARDLQDPSDKRQILCDNKMQLVFKQDKVHMFTMNKILGKQLYDVEE
jgi:hypothetical protein